MTAFCSMLNIQNVFKAIDSSLPINLTTQFSGMADRLHRT
jgi:hypothetical protein